MLWGGQDEGLKKSPHGYPCQQCPTLPVALLGFAERDKTRLLCGEEGKRLCQAPPTEALLSQPFLRLRTSSLRLPGGRAQNLKPNAPAAPRPPRAPANPGWPVLRPKPLLKNWDCVSGLIFGACAGTRAWLLFPSAGESTSGLAGPFQAGSRSSFRGGRRRLDSSGEALKLAGPERSERRPRQQRRRLLLVVPLRGSAMSHSREGSWLEKKMCASPPHHYPALCVGSAAARPRQGGRRQGERTLALPLERWASVSLQREPERA